MEGGRRNLTAEACSGASRCRSSGAVESARHPRHPGSASGLHRRRGREPPSRPVPVRQRLPGQEILILGDAFNPSEGLAGDPAATSQHGPPPRRSSTTRRHPPAAPRFEREGRGRTEPQTRRPLDVARFDRRLRLLRSGNGVARDPCAFGYLGEPFWVLLCGRPRPHQGVPRKGEHRPRRVALPVRAAEGPGRLQPGGLGGAAVAPRLSLSALGAALEGASGRSRARVLTSVPVAFEVEGPDDEPCRLLSPSVEERVSSLGC